MKLLQKSCLLVFMASASLGSATAATSPGVERIIERAAETGSDALYISIDGETVVDWVPEDGERSTIELMSAVKSLVAIAIGRLLHDGDLESLDTPVHELFPEWKQGRKQDITVRHLLNHTSGLQNVPNAGAEIYPAPDAVQLALAAELGDEPGTRFAYNNKATNLLAGVIERASGQRMDLYFQERLFQPLGINHYQWYFDKSGTPHAMAGLQLYARDAAKFGQLVLNKGRWGDEQLIDPDYLAAMLSAGQEFYPLAGLLWWAQPVEQVLRVKDEALDVLREQDADAYEKLATLRGQEFGDPREAVRALAEAFDNEHVAALEPWFGSNLRREIFDWDIGSITAWYADGYLGQYIVIVPETGVVAVRQIRSRPDYDREMHAFRDFIQRVTELPGK